MAWDSAFQIIVDGEQSRLGKDRNLVFCQGSYDGQRGDRVIGWDLNNSSDTAVDPSTFTAFLGMYQNSPTWHTTFTGNYARKRKTDFAFLTSANWEEQQIKGTADYWLLGKNLPNNETILTTATFGANRGFFVSILVPSTGTEEYEVYQAGWNTTATYAAGVGVRLFSSGRMMIYRGGNFLGERQISGANTGSNTGQRWVSLLLIPGRRNELIVIPDQGTGFSFEFEELRDTTAPEITPASTKFWMKFPGDGTRSVTVQICPLTYPTSGYICAKTSYFSEPPATGDTMITEENFRDLAGAGTTAVTSSLREVTNVATTFVPNGVKKSCTQRFDLTGDGNYTPFVYGGVDGYTYTHVDTDDAELADITDATTSRVLKVGETADSDELSLVSIGIPVLTAAGMEDPIGHSGRPVKVEIDGETIFDGVTLPPSIDAAPDEAAYEIGIKAESLWKLLEAYQFRSPYPLDGLTLLNAIKFLLRTAGIKDASMDIEDPTITIDEMGGASSGEWGQIIQPGDTAAKWIETLFETYASDWFYGFVPKDGGGMKFLAQSPTGLGTTSVVTLWGTVAEATAQLVTEGYSAGDAAKFHAHRLWQDYREEKLEPECNELRITGQHPRTGDLIQSYKKDTASMDATTLPSLRPSNWLGYRSIVAIAHPGLTTRTAVDRAVNALYPRLTKQRRLASFKCPNLIRLTPTGQFIWKPMRVTLKNVYDGADVVVRLSGLEANFDCKDAWPYNRIPTEYMGEIVSGSTPWRGSLRASNIDDALILHGERVKTGLPYALANPIQLYGAKTPRLTIVDLAP